MGTTEIKDLFENWHKYGKFDIARKIYDLTDKLNPFLVQAFINEYREHNLGLELDIKKLSGLDRTINSPVITCGYDENGDVEFLVDGKKYDFALLFPTMEKIFSSIQFGTIVDDVESKITAEDEPEPLDLSDTTAVEKIIYLNELGIIDFLRKETKAGISNSSLASVLSGITGIKAETIKPSVNRLSNNDTIDNKHPYYTKKTVDKIQTFLIKLGF